jgi:hypothetical protein
MEPSRPLEWPLSEDDAIVGMCAAPSSTSYVVVAVSESAVFVASFDEPTRKFIPRILRSPFDEGAPSMLAVSGVGQPVIWVSTRAGELAKSLDLGETWVRCAALGRASLTLGTREDGSLSLLARKGDTIELLTSTDGTRWFAQRMIIELQTGVQGAPLWVAHRGSAIAVGDAGGVSIARDGRHFARIAGSAGATAGTFAGSTADAPLLLAGAFGEGDDTLHLARVVRDGAVEVVGEIRPITPSEDGSDLPRVLFLGWHETSESVSVGLASQMSTWGRNRKKGKNAR